MTIGEWTRQARAKLAGETWGYQDALLIAQHVTGLDRTRIRFSEEALPEKTLASLDGALARRLSGEPVQYITGEAYFMGLRFIVTSAVLIPRADTECLAEKALARLRGGEKVLDLCCGSGCIGLSIARNVGISLTLSDISPASLDIARQNAALLGIEASFRQGNMFSGVGDEAFDLIVCNPPYIPAGDIPRLSREVLREPRAALDGGEDGLDFYRILAREAGRHLLPGGCAMLEIGYDQAESAGSLFPGCVIDRDLGGNPRVLTAERKTVWGI